MAWFGRAKGPRRVGEPDPVEHADPTESAAEPPVESAAESAAQEQTTDTVGNPILRRSGRHAAAETGPTRAEHRMLQFVAEGRVARTTTGGAAGAFWRIDRAFATETKAMMLDWLLEQGYVEPGQRSRVAVTVVLTDRGRSALGG